MAADPDDLALRARAWWREASQATPEADPPRAGPPRPASGGFQGLPRLTVVVPALNEEANLRAAAEAVLEHLGPRTSFLEVLVFNDASQDSTGWVAEQLMRDDPRVRAFHNPRRLGIGGIYQAGLRLARGDYYLLIPGDNETRVDEIAPYLVTLDLEPVPSLLLFYPTNPQVRPWRRRLASWVYMVAVRLLFGCPTLRYANGTNIVLTGLARQLGLRTAGFAYQTEVVVRVLWRGIPCAQAGIRLQPRRAGRSTALSWANLQAVAGALARLGWELRVTTRERRRRGAIWSLT